MLLLPLVLLVLLTFVVVMWLVLLILPCDCCVVAVAVSLMGATAKGQKELKSEFKQKMFVIIVGCVCVCVCGGCSFGPPINIGSSPTRLRALQVETSRVKLIEICRAAGEGVKGEWVVCLYLKMSTSHGDVTNAKNS